MTVVSRKVSKELCVILLSEGYEILTSFPGYQQCSICGNIERYDLTKIPTVGVQFVWTMLMPFCPMDALSSVRNFQALKVC